MTMFKLFITSVLLLFCSALQANTVSQVNTTLKADIVTGEFKQYKQLAGFASPFVSSGVFSLNAKKLVWEVEQPVKSALIVENGQVLVENAKGEFVPQPGSEQFVGLLTDLLSVDMSALATRFSIKAQNNCLQLTPKEALLQQLFSHFTLCESDKTVHSIILYEHSGSKTTIEFSYPEQP